MKLINRNQYCNLLFFSSLLFFSCKPEPELKTEIVQKEPIKKEMPNILLIMADDLGYGDLSIMGATDMQTPNIDQIAKSGLRFTNFYANAPVCSPSRAATLTGKYPDLVGVPGVVRGTLDNSYGFLNGDFTMLPETLGKEGYDTGIIGKWHLGLESPNLPNDRGFKYFKGFLGGMMDNYWTHLRRGKNLMRMNKDIIDPKGHATDVFTDWTLDYLKNKTEGEKPFFLYLAYNAPHYPIEPPEDFLEQVKSRDPSIPEKRAKNVALIEHLDFSVGKVMNYLEASGLIENTIVIFTSDNGGALRFSQSNGKLRGSKQDMYEGGIRVPFFMSWKNKIKPNTTATKVSMLMDIYPTLCDITGIEKPKTLDGEGFLQVSNYTPKQDSDRTLFWVRREGGNKYGGLAYYAARKSEFKIVQNTPYEPNQIFDIEKDETESSPIPYEKFEAYQKMRYELQQHIIKSGAVPWRDKEVIRKMEIQTGNTN